MTDPDERIINRALMYLEDDDPAIAEHRENARAALHRIFRNTRKLEAEVERLQGDIQAWEVRAEMAEEQVERLRAALTYLHEYEDVGLAFEKWVDHVAALAKEEA